MKQSIEYRRFALAMLATLATVYLRAATGTWDADPGTAGAQDGSGNWNTVDANWWSGTANAAWSDGTDAVFGNATGAAGIVTLNGGSVKPNSLTFNAAGSGAYTVNASGPYLIDLGGGARVFTVNAGAATLACGVTNGGLAKLGSGDLALTGPSSVSTFQINGGSMTVATNLTITGTNTGCFVYLGDGRSLSGTLTINTGATVRVTGAFADAGVIGRNGGKGAVYQSGGLFQWAPTDSKALYIGASSDPQTTALYAMSGGTLDLANNVLGVGLGLGSGTITGTLNQVGGVITNVGTLRVGSDNTAGTGSYTLGGGMITIGAGGIASQSGKYNLNLGGGTVVAKAGWTSTLNMNLTNLNGSVMFDTAGNAVSLGGVLSGNGGLNKKGAGALTLTNANTYSGATIVYTGDVAIAHANALGVGNVAVANSARLLVSGNISVTNTLALGSEVPAYNNQLLSTSGSNIWGGPITVGGSSIAVSFGSTLRITNGVSGASYCSFAASGLAIIEKRPITLANQTVFFGGGVAGVIQLNVGNNVFSTANFWGGETLLLGLPDALPTTVVLTANNAAGGKLNLNGFNQTVGTLNQNSTYVVTVTNSGPLATFTVNQSANTAFAGLIGGNLTLVKSGAGALTLTNVNTHTGGTVISNGTLRLGVPNALPAAGAVEVAGGTLDLGGLTVTNDAVTVRGGSVLNGTLCPSTLELVGTGIVRVAVGGSGGLRKTGAGTSDVLSALSYAGPTEVAGGTLRLEPLPLGTMAFYGFDDASNLGLDLSAKGNALKTLTGSPQYSASGRLGGALYLDGSTTLGTLSGRFPDGVPTGAAPYTVSAFIKVVSDSYVQGGWIGYGNTATSQANNFRLGGTYTNVWEYWWANDMGAALPSGSFTDGWHSVVGTWDGSAQRIYIDGVERASRTASNLNVGTNLFVIGKTIGDANFKGWVDELLIANRAFSAGEVASLHASGAAIQHPLPTSTALKVAAGAALDLNGNGQTVAGLSGEGTVTGGVLTVTGRLSAGVAAGAIGTLGANSGLTLASGVTNAVDCSTTEADAVNVKGTLTLLGSGTVEVSLSDPRHPPAQVTLFTFNALVSGENLTSWSVTGVPGGFRAKLSTQANSIVMTISRVGTLVSVK